MSFEEMNCFIKLLNGVRENSNFNFINIPSNKLQSEEKKERFIVIKLRSSNLNGI